MSRFDVLDDLEFEDLCAELLTAETGLAYRAGARGRDQGVDLLAIDRGARHEGQCKHYRSGGSSALKRAARAEADELSRRMPELASYRFLCSGRLSHKARVELGEILSPWLGGDEHLLDGHDLERLLDLHPEVERRFVKLWFQGVGQLKSVLSAASYARSRALLADIRASMGRYVETAAFHDARAQLEEEGVLIVCGAPGVGKTALASLLVMDSLAAGYSPYEIVPGELSAAWELLDDGGERQLFVFDDFLGEVRLESRRGSDRDLVRFMGEVRRRGNARLVITSREYILQEARELSELLDAEIRGGGRFLLQMEDYTRIERARIFYHHIWCSSGLDDGARETLLRQQAYELIVDHPNYNPRLIEWVTGFSGHALSDADRENYVDFCLGVLDSPHRLWRLAFETGIGEAGMALLFALALMPRRASLAELEAAFSGAARAGGIDQRKRLFRRTVSMLEGSFLTLRQGLTGELVASLLNPSLEDFIEEYLKESPADTVAVARGIVFFDQAAKLAAMFDAQRSELPPPLAAPLAEAFRRTIITPDERLTWIELDDRLETVLSLVRNSASLRPRLLTWLSLPAKVWLRALRPYGNLPEETFLTALALIEHGVIDRMEVTERLYGCVRGQPPCLTQWLRVRWLASVLPGCFKGLRWEKEREGFEVWLVQALGDPIAHFERWEVGTYGAETPWRLHSFDWDPPETLRDLATTFEVDVDDLAYERAFEEFIASVEEEESWLQRSAALSQPGAPAAIRSASRTYSNIDDEGDVVALFERLRAL